MTLFTREPIRIEGLISQVSDAGRGATVVFVGTVRRGGTDGLVEAIDYSAYEEMAGPELARVLAEARERWPGLACVAQHRLGMIPTGEASIAVVTAATHRAAAFEAARYILEEAKRRLPVWKRERFDNGSARWRED